MWNFAKWDEELYCIWKYKLLNLECQINLYSADGTYFITLQLQCMKAADLCSTEDTESCNTLQVPAPRQTAWSNKLTLEYQPTPSAQIMLMLLIFITFTEFGKQNDINTSMKNKKTWHIHYLIIITWHKNDKIH